MTDRLSAPDSLGASQRRSLPRIDAVLEIDFESDHTFFSGFSENLSDGGLFVATYAGRRIGERLYVRFTLPGLESPIEAKVQVRWLREYDVDGSEHPGFGAGFVDLAQGDRELIQRVLERRAPLFFEG